MSRSEYNTRGGHEVIKEACHPSCTNSKVICATGFLFVAGTWREYKIFVMFNDLHRVWTKMLQLVAPAGDPKPKNNITKSLLT